MVGTKDVGLGFHSDKVLSSLITNPSIARLNCNYVSLLVIGSLYLLVVLMTSNYTFVAISNG